MSEKKGEEEEKEMIEKKGTKGMEERKKGGTKGEEGTTKRGE